MNEIGHPVGSPLEPHLFNELKAALDDGLASGKLMTQSQITRQLALFAEQFGPAVLRGLDGEVLLRRVHGREDRDARCLALPGVQAR